MICTFGSPRLTLQAEFVWEGFWEEAIRQELIGSVWAHIAQPLKLLMTETLTVKNYLLLGLASQTSGVCVCKEMKGPQHYLISVLSKWCIAHSFSEISIWLLVLKRLFNLIMEDKIHGHSSMHFIKFVLWMYMFVWVPSLNLLNKKSSVRY